MSGNRVDYVTMLNMVETVQTNTTRLKMMIELMTLRLQLAQQMQSPIINATRHRCNEAIAWLKAKREEFVNQLKLLERLHILVLARLPPTAECVVDDKPEVSGAKDAGPSAPPKDGDAGPTIEKVD